MPEKFKNGIFCVSKVFFPNCRYLLNIKKGPLGGQIEKIEETIGVPNITKEGP